MLDHLSPGECAELEAAERRGETWARALRAVFLDGTRLVLGIDHAPSDRRIAAAAGLAEAEVREALARAALWCRSRGLHLLDFPDGRPGEGRRHLMAVG
jgi:hypothetical protein